MWAQTPTLVVTGTGGTSHESWGSYYGDYGGTSFTISAAHPSVTPADNFNVSGSFGSTSVTIHVQGNVVFGHTPFAGDTSWLYGASATLNISLQGTSGTDYAIDITRTASMSAATADPIGAYSASADSTSVNTVSGPPSASFSTVSTVRGTGSISTTTSLGANVGFRQVYCRASDAEGCLGDWVGYPGGGAGTVDYTLTIVARTIRPNQQPPTAIIDPIGGVSQNVAVTLNGSNSHANTSGASLIEYKWAIQNSSGGTDTLFGPTVQYTWSQVGTQLVTLTVTDSDGLTGADSSNVTVSGTCDLPSGEQFQPTSHWDFGAVNGYNSVGYDFTVMLVGGSGNFYSRQVREFDAAPGIDTCGTPNSVYHLSTNVTGSTWFIGSDNMLTDTVGVRADIVSYFQSTLVGSDSCSGTWFQQMKMFCPSTGQWAAYGPVNRIEFKIFTNRVSVSRAGVTATRRYP